MADIFTRRTPHPGVLLLIELSSQWTPGNETTFVITEEDFVVLLDLYDDLRNKLMEKIPKSRRGNGGYL